MPVGDIGREATGVAAQGGGVHQSHGDRVAVPPAVPLVLFDGVAQRVAVVEDLAEPGLAEILGHHARLHPYRPFYQFLE